jgi:hypothetical protein
MKLTKGIRRTSAALTFSIVAVALNWILCGCNKKPAPIAQVSSDARPELRQAVAAICTSGQLLDNYGDDLQVAFRLHTLTEELHFKPEPKDRTTLREIMTNGRLSSYSRMCAAFFLADFEPDARALLTNYLASSDLRRRFNAARTIQWFAWRPNDEAREWAVGELIKMVENKSLELPAGTYTPSSTNTEAEGYDSMDDAWSPLGHVVDMLGDLGDRRAVPGLSSLVHSTNGDYRASSALQKITSRSVHQRADQRAIDEFFTIAVSSGSTLLRRKAIWTLARMDNTNALLALVSVIETNVVTPADFDKQAILQNRPSDYSRRGAARALRQATFEDFQYDTQKWRHWIVNVGNKLNKGEP